MARRSCTRASTWTHGSRSSGRPARRPSHSCSARSFRGSGPDLALEAVAIARRTRPELRLAVAGAPLDAAGERLCEHLEARARHPDLAGAVDLLGELSDPREALGAASVLLHCADAEPFGMALVEALAAGRPVVAPAAGGPLDIVTPACGALYEPGDAAAAAAALLATLDRIDRGEPLGAAARERAEAEFDLRDARARWVAAAGVELRA